MADDDGLIRREKKKPKPEEAKPPEPKPPEPKPPEASAPAEPAHTQGSKHDEGTCPGCARLRSALRENRKKLRRMNAENRTLREELLSAGEMIEDLAGDLEKPV